MASVVRQVDLDRDHLVSVTVRHSLGHRGRIEGQSILAIITLREQFGRHFPCKRKISAEVDYGEAITLRTFEPIQTASDGHNAWGVTTWILRGKPF
jgi:hypothetical protein